MSLCWARCLGGCAGGMSGEHYISETVLGTEKLLVTGKRYGWDELKELPFAALTRKHLCKKHNEELSPVDAEGGRLRRFIEERWVYLQAGGAPMPKHFQVRRFLNGWLLERWFVKTTINAAYEIGEPVGRNAPAPGHVDPEWVAAAFGRSSLIRRAGLYLWKIPNVRREMQCNTLCRRCSRTAGRLGRTSRFKRRGSTSIRRTYHRHTKCDV